MTRNNIARLNTDGTLDTAFNPNANDAVYSIAVQADGKILVGGNFTEHIGGQTRNRIARLDPTTGLADSFNPNANESSVDSIAVQADGKILAGGDFTSIGGQTRNRIARLDPTTGLADSFDPNANGSCLFNRGAGGRQDSGGRRFHAASADRRATASPGSIPRPAWQIRSTRTRTMSVHAIAVQADGKILVGGDFTTIGGQTRNRIARLDATTGLADSFNPNANDQCLFNRGAGGRQDFGGRRFHPASADRRATASPGSIPRPAWLIRSTRTRTISVYSIAVQADGKILAGGNFTSIGGQTRNLFARLSNDTAALQNLAVTQTTITWTAAAPARNSRALPLSLPPTM